MDALRTGCLLAGCLYIVLAVPGLACATGLAGSENFVVLAENQPLADEILAQAEKLRKSLSKEWLGEELSEGVGRASIRAELTDEEDRGRTYARLTDRREHLIIWLNTSRERATGSTLAHEMTHVVLAIRYRGQLPAWADEGAASLQDDEARRDVRRRTMQWMAQTGQWANLLSVLEKPAIEVTDQRGYSVAVSLTEFLLSRGDKPRLLEFASAGKERGWNAALVQYYGLRDIAALQAAWQSWVAEGQRTTAMR